MKSTQFFPPSINPREIAHACLRSRFVVAAALALTLPSIGPGQTSSGDSDKDNEEVVTLDEFQVKSTTLKNSYIATESTAGTRFAEKLISIPYSVDVMTEEMIEDFQLYSDDDILSLIGGATADTGSTELRVRGFSSIRTRDGFQFGLPASPSNTKQKEFIKGPQSILYGRTAPGGILNSVTRRPMKKPRYSAAGVYGTDGFRRASVTATGPLIPKKLYYYAYFDYMGSRDFDHWGSTGISSKFEVDGVKNDSYYSGLQFLYVPRQGTSIYFTFEYQPAETVQGSSGAIAYATSSRNNNTGNLSSSDKGIRAYNIGKLNNYYADNAYRDADFYGLNVLLEHKINRTWSARASVQTYTKDTDKLRYNSGTNYFIDADEFSIRYPYAQDQKDNVVALQSEIVGTWFTKNAQHRLMLAVDGSLRKQDDTETIANTLTTTYVPPSWRLHLYAPNPHYADSIENEYITRTYGDTVLKTRSAGALASYRIVFPRQNLTLMGSLRYDYFKDELDDRLALVTGSRTESQTTYSAGLLYRILGDKLLFFASTSTGYTPKGTIDHGTTSLVPAEESQSVEFGFKGASENNTLGFTLAAFDMTLRNVSVLNDDYSTATPDIPEYSTAGKQTSRGVEGRVFIQPVSGLTLAGSFGYIDNEVKNAPADSYNFMVGKPATMIAKWNAALVAKYNFPEHLLPGLSMGMTLNYRTEVTSYYETSEYYGREMPSLWLMKNFIRYEWKTGKFKHALTLNLHNTLDKEYYSRGGRLMQGREARLTYKLRY